LIHDRQTEEPMVDVSRREELEREFDLMADEGSFTAQLAGSRRPNSDVKHEMDESLERSHRFMPTIIASLLRVTRRLGSPAR
jgi:hypothetical protein